MIARTWTRSAGLAAGLALVTAGCGKGAAEQAVSAATSAFEQAKPEIERYVPDELKALTSDLTKATAAFDKGDYQGALAAGQSLLPKIQAALEAARRKKDELLKAFDELKARLPALLEALRKRLSQLARTKVLPEGLDLSTVETAEANLDTVAKTWTDAVARFDSGDLPAAVGQANEVKTQLEEMAKAFLPAKSKK